MTLKVTDPTSNSYVGGLMVALEIVRERLSSVREAVEAADRLQIARADKHYLQGKVNALLTVEDLLDSALRKYTGEEPKP